MIPINIDINSRKKQKKKKKRGKINKVSNKFVKDKDPIPDILHAQITKNVALQRTVRLSARKQNLGLQNDYLS